MKLSITLPTGETLEPLPQLDGEPEWDEAMSLMAQAIPACISIRWCGEIARVIVDHVPNMQNAAGNLMPLIGGPLGQSASFLSDVLRLAVTIGVIIQRRLESDLDDLDAFNKGLSAADVLRRLTFVADPVFRPLGIIVPDVPPLASVANQFQAERTVRLFADYVDQLRNISDSIAI